MEEWKSYKLGDIATIQTGPFGSQLHQSDYVDEGIPCIMPTNIGQMLDFHEENLAHITKEDSERLSRHLVHEGEIIYSRRGDIEKCAYVSNEQEGWFCGTGCLKISITSPLAIPKFVAYQLSTAEIRSWIVGNAVGTTMLNLNTSVLSDVPLRLPALTTQMRIVEMLDSLSNKIALNNRINHNLEEQARSLYKSWFIDFEPFKDGKFVDSELGMIPEGWHIGTLSEIADITMGQSPSGSSFNEDGHGIIFYQGRTEFGFRFPSIKLFTTEPTRFAEPHSVLMSVRAPVGDINVALDRCCIGRGLAAITAKDEAFSFVLYTLKGKSSELDLYNGEGTVFGSINRKDLEGLSVLIPPMSIIQQFNDCIRPIDESIEIACKEIVNLSFSRDSLLPRLMSGQLSFDECDC